MVSIANSFRSANFARISHINAGPALGCAGGRAGRPPKPGKKKGRVTQDDDLTDTPTGRSGRRHGLYLWLIEHAWLLPLLVFVAVYAWRPFALGFYSDDWPNIVEAAHHGGPFSWERWLQINERIPLARPLQIPLMFLLSSLFSKSAVLWQLSLLAVVAVTAWALRVFLGRLLGWLGAGSGSPADFAVALWLAVPWSLGYSAWPVALPNMLSFLLFLLAGIVLLRSRSIRSVAGAALLFGASILTYEAFYLQFLPLLALVALGEVAPAGAVDAGSRSISALRRALGERRALAWAGLGLLAVQLGAVGWNRLAAELQPWTAKRFNDQWAGETLESLGGLPHQLALTLPLGRGVATAAVLILLASIVASVLRHPRRGRETHAMVAAVLLIALCGLILGVVVLSMAGYSLAALGRPSRTFISPNFWLLLGTVALLLLVEGARLRQAVTVGALVLVVFLSTANVNWVREWAQIWQVEREMVAEFPAEQFQGADAEALVLVRNGLMVENARVFPDSWSIGGAIVDSHPSTRNPDGSYRRFVPYKPGWRNYWNGSRLTQRAGSQGDERKLEFSGSELWIWDLARDTVERWQARGEVP